MSTRSAANDPDDRWRKLYGVATRVETTASLAEIAMILRVAQRAFPESADPKADYPRYAVASFVSAILDAVERFRG